jgi:hypothetical protein
MSKPEAGTARPGRATRPRAPAAAAATPQRAGARSVATPPHGHAHVVADRVWLVLARRGYEEPLRQVGTVTADDVDLARVYARTIYDEFAWVEMAVVPRDAVVTVIES